MTLSLSTFHFCVAQHRLKAFQFIVHFIPPRCSRASVTQEKKSLTVHFIHPCCPTMAMGTGAEKARAQDGWGRGSALDPHVAL